MRKIPVRTLTEKQLLEAIRNRVLEGIDGRIANQVAVNIGDIETDPQAGAITADVSIDFGGEERTTSEEFDLKDLGLLGRRLPELG
jgi:hypothetical protein